MPTITLTIMATTSSGVEDDSEENDDAVEDYDEEG